MTEIFICTRPIYRYSMGLNWQARRGSDSVGPVRLFMWEAYWDLPIEARAEYLPKDALSWVDATHVRMTSEFRIAPVFIAKPSGEFNCQEDFAKQAGEQDYDGI
jgi:hypothetical protein